jgi:hypothetical protein
MGRRRPVLKGALESVRPLDPDDELLVVVLLPEPSENIVADLKGLGGLPVRSDFLRLHHEGPREPAALTGLRAAVQAGDHLVAGGAGFMVSAGVPERHCIAREGKDHFSADPARPIEAVDDLAEGLVRLIVSAKAVEQQTFSAKRQGGCSIRFVTASLIHASDDLIVCIKRFFWAVETPEEIGLLLERHSSVGQVAGAGGAHVGDRCVVRGKSPFGSKGKGKGFGLAPQRPAEDVAHHRTGRTPAVRRKSVEDVDHRLVVVNFHNPPPPHNLTSSGVPRLRASGVFARRIAAS